MPYWSRGPQLSSHAATIACAAYTTRFKGSTLCDTGHAGPHPNALVVLSADALKKWFLCKNSCEGLKIDKEVVFVGHARMVKQEGAHDAVTQPGAGQVHWGAHPQAVPVIHKGQVLVAREGCAHKLLHDGGLSL